MVIGIVLSNPPAYSETFFNSKIKGLKKNGYEVVLFVSEKKEDFNLCEVKSAPSIYKGNPIALLLSFIKVYFQLLFSAKRVIRFSILERIEGTSFLLIIKKLYLNAHIISYKKVDWLHFGFATTALGREHLAKSINSKMAVSFRGYDINVYPLKYEKCYDTLWETVDKAHSISNYLLDKAYHLGLQKGTKATVITPAVVVDENISVTEQCNKIVITTVARLNWIKGLTCAIKSMKLLKDMGLDFEYQIIGYKDPKVVEQYQYLVHELGLEGYVTFCGKLTHKESLQKIKNSTIYIQPSINEGFCNAVLEAQALGVLCIVTDTGGLPENVVNNSTGWVVSKSDALCIALKIKEVLSLPENRKKEIKNNAINRVISDFTIEKQQKEFVKFYRDL